MSLALSMRHVPALTLQMNHGGKSCEKGLRYLVVENEPADHY
jgi:hypothetical protein